MTSLFFAVISVPLVLARLLHGSDDHRGVALVWLWFLDPVPCWESISDPAFFPPLSTLHLPRSRKQPRSFGLGLTRAGHIALTVKSIIFKLEKRAPNVYKHVLHMVHLFSFCLLCSVCTISAVHICVCGDH